MKGLVPIVVACIAVMGGVYVWHVYEAPKLQSYLLELSVSPSSKDIGKLSITNGQTYSYNISGSYFNVTLGGFVNYTVTFAYNVTYGSYYNTTAHIYLQSNLSVSFKTNTGSATPGPIYIK